MTPIGAALTSTPYRVERMLGVGGMAEIYLAREMLSGGGERHVVLKRLLPQHRDDEELVTMFFDETRVSTLIRHPNVVEVYGSLRCDRDCLIVMEYVPGPSLKELLLAAARSSLEVLPEPEAVLIGRTLAETMDAVHQAEDADGKPLNVVHRDLNPANIIVSRTGVIKIIDFGIAQGETRVHETATGMLKGTAGYMAPEQLEASGRTDARTDVFALGVVLYEAFVGQHPFATENLLELHALISSGRYVAPRQARGTIPPSIASLIERCLRPDPAARPQHMGEVAGELAAHLRAYDPAPTESTLADLVARVA